MTPSKLTQCRAIAALDHIKCTFDNGTGEFRVTLDGLDILRAEEVAYYTDDYVDALSTAANMSLTRTKELANG